MSQRPSGPPIGLQLSGTAKVVSRAFNDALVAVGGSTPSWLVLMSLKRQPSMNQSELAAAVGIQGATLSHHLSSMEADGMLTRRRDPANRRVHVVELTGAGEAAFVRMREAAVSFDQRLRTGLDSDDLKHLSRMLARLENNVAGSEDNPSVLAPNTATPCTDTPFNEVQAP